MIFLTGDTHGLYDLDKLKNWSLGSKLTKKDYLIVLGDFGLLWKDKKNDSETYLTNWYDDKPWTTLFVDGNHENFNRIKKLPEIEMFGSLVGKVSNSIFHLKRGNVYTIEGKKILTVGGALSIDKHYRIKNHTWWEAELIDWKDMENINLNIESNNYSFDYILTHTCPKRIFHEMDGLPLKVNDPTMKIFDILLDKLKSFNHWYFGHFHVNQKITDKFTCLYDQIVELK